ncbi:MAG: PQQ-dependent sugar dehydrogenase [Bacteroidota bacterium]
MHRRFLAVALALAALSLPVSAQPVSLETAGAAVASAARSASQAATFPAGFYVEDAVGESFVLAVTVAFAPDGRMFVVEKRGLVWVVENGVRQPVPFLDISREVLNQQDRGLLGIALDPDFETNGYVYLAYTVDHEETADRRRHDAYNRITRYAARTDNPNLADLNSRTILIGETFTTGIPSCHRSHSIGTLQFGSDGTLLVGAGDGASFSTMDDGGLYAECFGSGKLDASEDIGSFRSQRLESLAGKILRIDPATGQGLPSNPFYTGDPDDTASKVWALGFRNPYRFSVQPGGSTDPADGDPGVIYLGDVGWKVWEEMNVVRKGENHGWPCREGARPNNDYQNNGQPATNGCSTPPTGVITDPSYEWHHSNASLSTPSGRKGRAILSGDFISGTRYPSFYRDAVFYADYANGWIAAARVDGAGDLTQERLFSGDYGPSGALVFDPVSELLHIVSLSDGRIYRLRHVDEATNSVPVAVAAASPTQGGVGVQVQFTPEGSFDPDGTELTYLWTFGDGASSTDRAPLHIYTEPGLYTATLEVSDGIDTATQTTTVKVRAGGLPTVQIVSPTRDLRVAPGETVQLEALVSDPDQAASTLSVRWSITQVHENHIHPDVFVGSGQITQFTAEEHGEDGELYYYRVRVAVRDATGLESIDERPLFLTGSDGESDVTTRGTPFALGTSLNGYPIGLIRDGDSPDPGTVAYNRQFDSFAGAGNGLLQDGVGYTFEDTLRFTRVAFQEGMHYGDGGWFETLRVQVRSNGTWRDVVGTESAPEYRATDGRSFDTYELSFVPSEGDAIRIVGRPGGSAGFISVGELRAWAVEAGTGGDVLPDGWTASDVGLVPVFGSTVSPEPDAFTLTGSGDAWYETDAFHFVSRQLDADGVLTARVTALSNGLDWAKAGLVVRSGLESGAPYVGVFLSNLGVHHQERLAAGGATEGPVDLWGRAEPVWLRVERVGTTVTTSLSDDGVAWTLIRTTTVPTMTGPVVIGMTTSSSARTGTQTATATFRDVAVTAAFPAPWTARDLGSPGVPGSASATGSAFQINGSGDLWGSVDAAHLVQQPMSGDGSIIARVASFSGAADWARAALVIRNDLTPGAPYAAVALTNLGVHLQYRADAGGSTAGPLDLWGLGSPIWLRLDRQGTDVAAFHSSDGTAWTPIGTVSVPGLTQASVVAGMAVSSSDPTVTASATFDSVSVSSGGAGPPIAGLRAATLQFGVEPIFPNPVQNRASIRIVLAEAGEVQVDIYDVLGRLVQQERVEAAAGILDLGLDLQARSSGTYVARVTAASGETDTQTFTIAR